MYAHYYADNPEAAAREAVDDSFDMAAELARADAEAGEIPDDFEEV